MKLFRASLLLSVLAASSSVSFGQSTWTDGANNGLWASPANWSPIGEPIDPIGALINIPATITLPSSTTGYIEIQTSVVNLSASANDFSAGYVFVDTGGTLNLSIAGGATFTTGNEGSSNFIGDAAGPGTFNVSSSTGTGGILDLVSNPGFATAVGIGGTGAFSQSGNVNVIIGSDLIIGADGNFAIPAQVPASGVASGGVGTYTVSGTSTLTAETIAIGIGSGTGNGVASGGSTPTSGLLAINGGTVTVDTLYLGINGNDLTKAVNAVTGAVSQTAGAVTITDLAIGVSPGAVGTYAISGGSLAVNDLDIGGTGANGTLTQSGGSITTTGTFNIGTGGGTGVFYYNGGTLATDGITVGPKGTFVQGTNITFAASNPTNPITLNNGNYDLDGGVLSIAGSTNTAGNGISGTGNLNFDGGTLLATGAFTDTLNGTISGTSAIYATTTATLAGVMGGNGTLIVGAGTVDLTGVNNNGSWGASLTGGSTLNATSVASLSTNGSFAIGTGSTLNVGSSGAATDVFAGSISGTGNFITGANDTSANKLVLSGTTNITGGSTTIGAGGFGSLEVDNGTIANVNGAAGNALDTFDVGNGGSIGTVTLLGNNVLPMATVNSGSTLFASGNLTGSLNNFGTLGTLGTLNNPASFLISNNLTTSGTIIIHSNASQVDTFGTAAAPLTTATVSGVVKVNGIGTVTNVPIIYTTGGVTVAGPLMTNPATPLFSSSVSVVGTNLDLSTHQNLLSQFAQTPNQNAVAGSIDNVILNGPPFQTNFVTLLGMFNQLSAAELPVAMEQLTPESLQYARDIAFENSTFMMERINGVAANLRGGYGGLDSSEVSVISPGFESGLGRSLGSLLAYNDPAFHSAAPNGVNYYPGGESGPSSSSPSITSPEPTWDSSSQVMSDSPNPYLAAVKPGGKETPRMSEFIGGDVVLADLNQSQSGENAPSSKASYTAGDATAGVSFRMTSHLAAGVLFDYNHTDAKTDSSGSKTDVDSYSPAVFATYFDGGFYATGIASFGYNTYSNTRNIGFLGETAHSSPDGQQYVGDLDVGYDFHPNKAWVVGPTLGLTYTHLDVDSFSESGAPEADLNIQSQSADSLRSRLGGHLVYQTNTGDVLLQPNFTAMWQHEYLDDSSGITSSFNSFSSTPFTIQSAAPSRDSALIGIGLTATLSNSMALYLNYLADVGADDYWAQSVIGGFKARF